MNSTRRSTTPVGQGERSSRIARRFSDRAGTEVTRPLPSFGFEVRSARHLEELAASPLPLPIAEAERRVSRHRDLYLDTPDDMLRRRNISCRLRISADDTRFLSLRLGSDSTASESRFDSKVQSTDPSAAVLENTPTGRRLRALVDPATLVVRLEIQTDRITRFAERDWLRRYSVEIHYDRAVARRNGVSSTVYQMCLHARRGDATRATELAHALEIQHGLRSNPERTRERAELMLKWKRGPEDSAPDAADSPPQTETHPAQFLNPELSLLAFQSRVLALAENSDTPLHERLRFLSIVSSNLDEFFMIRVAGLRQTAREQSEEQCDDGLTRGAQLQLIGDSVTDLVARQSACAELCLTALANEGVRIVRWSELNPRQREELRRRCIEEIHPDLTPMAMTLSPGHPLPHLPHLTLALAVARRDPETRRLHLAELELPAEASRFFDVPGNPGHFITIEEIVRSNIDLVSPAGGVEGVYVFRVTRGGELTLDEEGAEDLIEAVAHASGKRTSNPAVRIEVERAMPAFVRDLLLDNLRREDPSALLDSSDINEVDGLLDLRCLSRLGTARDPGAHFPAFEPAEPLTEERSVMEAMRESDLMYHHPFDSFAATVLRFLREAADDPDVTTIRITLYRLGASSEVADALIRAARSGKKVIAFVELKARFDEDHNVGWARKLEKAGGHVISGLVGVKNHEIGRAQCRE